MNPVFFKLVLAVVLMFFVFFAMNVSAYEIDNNMCKCDNCEDCTKALENRACSVVQLTRSLDESVMGKSDMSCIVNPAFGSGKTFDCNNYKIERCPTCGQDEKSYAVYLRDKKNMIIKNCNFVNFRIGVNIYSSSDIKLTNNKFSNGYEGIYIKEGTKCALENNIIENMELTGIHLLNSNENFIGNNDLTGIVENRATAIFLEKSDKNLIKNNNANNRKERGIFLKESNNNALLGNSVNECNVGIHIEYSSGNNISENKASKCLDSSVFLIHSSKNIISKNKANSNKKYGMRVSQSHQNLISENEIRNNAFSYGLYIDYSSDNNISKNLITSNRIGIYSIGSKNFISENKVCRNKDYDFDSSNWMKSAGDNNYCDISDRWNDEDASGCTNKCKCESDDECGDDEMCENAKCKKLTCDKIYRHKCVECLNNSDCSKSEKCENNKCILKKGFCKDDTDCKDDEKCENNKCVQLECPGNEKIENHACVKVTEEENETTNETIIANDTGERKKEPKEEPQNLLPLILIAIIVIIVLYFLFRRKKTKTKDNSVKGKEDKIKEVKGEKI